MFGNLIFKSRKYVNLNIFIAICICSCNKDKNDFSWTIDKVKNSYNSEFVIPYHPRIQKIQLSPGALNHTITLIGPYISDNDTAAPKSIFPILTNLNEITHPKQNKDYWYVIKISNFTDYTNWAIRTNNQKIHPRLFQESSAGSDSIKEIIKSEKPWYNNKNILEDIFDLKIKQYEETTIMLNVKNEDVQFVDEFTIYPYDQIVSQPVQNTVKLGLLIGIVFFVSSFLVYFFIVTKQPGYPAFLLYFLFSLLLFVTMSDISPFSGFRPLPFIMYSLFPISRYIAMALIPFAKLKPTRTLGVLLFLMLLDITLTYSNTLFNIFIGSNYLNILDLLILIVFAFYCFDKKQINNRFTYSPAILLSLIILYMIFYCAQKGFLYLGRFYSILFIVEMVLYLFALVMRFADFKKAQRRKELDQAIAVEKDLSQTVIKTLEEERKRISEDIHDELGGNLAVLKIKIQSISNNWDQLDLVMKIIDKTSDSVRAISHSLMPPYFSETDLKTLLMEHFNHLNEKGAMQFKLYYVGQPYEFSKDQELMIYRVIMELVHNCVKHSQAKIVTVQLTYSNSDLEILCEDDGRGFPSSLHAGVGLQSINSRVLYLNGIINIDSNPNGTTVIIKIPIGKKR